MTIYLYKKTHKITGLKYLGKTSEPNPHKYLGSGTYWMRHLKKHGDDVETEILKECSSNDEVKQWGLYYSELWNVVESSEWANMKPEAGDGGAVGPDGAKFAPAAVIAVVRLHDHLERVSNFAHYIEVVVV